MKTTIYDYGPEEEPLVHVEPDEEDRLYRLVGMECAPDVPRAERPPQSRLLYARFAVEDALEDFHLPPEDDPAAERTGRLMARRALAALFGAGLRASHIDAFTAEDFASLMRPVAVRSGHNPDDAQLAFSAAWEETRLPEGMNPLETAVMLAKEDPGQVPFLPLPTPAQTETAGQILDVLHYLEAMGLRKRPYLPVRALADLWGKKRSHVAIVLAELKRRQLVYETQPGKGCYAPSLSLQPPRHGKPGGRGRA